jgi:hypothetical protein
VHDVWVSNKVSDNFYNSATINSNPIFNPNPNPNSNPICSFNSACLKLD